ncbi:MAG: FkbM family methyltransferase [Nibricoccus sp.]
MIKNSLKNIARSLGIELHRYSPHNCYHAALKGMLSALNINVVFDVGANSGQFGEEVFDTGYRGEIVSFEPLLDMHEKLSKRARRYSTWTVFPRAAVGAESGRIKMNVSANRVSSSILPILTSHASVAPDSAYISTEDVPLVRLDDAAKDRLTDDKSIFLKVDTQGFEWQVLDGAVHILKKAVSVQLELSLVPLYQGQRLWGEYVKRMEACGFNLYFAYPAFTNEVTGQTLQWDTVFVRKDIIESLKSQ